MNELINSATLDEEMEISPYSGNPSTTLEPIANHLDSRVPVEFLAATIFSFGLALSLICFSAAWFIATH